MKFWSVNKVDRVCEEVEICALFFKKQILPAHTQSSDNPKTENTLHKIALAGEKYKNLSKRNIGLPQLNNSWICMLQHIKCRQHNKTEKCRVLVEQNESSVDSGAACKKNLWGTTLTTALMTKCQVLEIFFSESVNPFDTEADNTNKNDFVRLPV